MFSRLNGLAWLAGTALSLSWSLGAHAAGDPALGEKKFYTCFGCHGIENYRNAYPDYSVPRLRHQDASYIVAALQEYRSGERPHATMHAQAASLTDQDMEDIAAYSDDQVGAAVRSLHDTCRDALTRYVKLAPVIDGVEGTFTKIAGLPEGAVKLVGNVPPSGKAPGGLLRHKGWKADKVELPSSAPGAVLAPAEIEIE